MISGLSIWLSSNTPNNRELNFISKRRIRLNSMTQIKLKMLRTKYHKILSNTRLTCQVSQIKLITNLFQPVLCKSKMVFNKLLSKNNLYKHLRSKTTSFWNRTKLIKVYKRSKVNLIRKEIWTICSEYKIRAPHLHPAIMQVESDSLSDYDPWLWTLAFKSIYKFKL